MKSWIWFVVVAALAACSSSESVGRGAGSGPVIVSAPTGNVPVSSGGPTGTTAARGSVAQAVGDSIDGFRDTAVNGVRQLASEAFAPSEKLVALLGTNPRAAQDKWPYMAYAFTAEEAVCSRAVGNGSVPVWRMAGTVAGCEWCSYHFYCAAANGVLTPVQPPVCNQRDAAWNWYSKDLQTACVPQESELVDGMRPETARMLNAALTAFKAVEKECDTPRLTQASHTVQEQLRLYINNCVYAELRPNAPYLPNQNCDGSEVSTCRPFKDWPSAVALPTEPVSAGAVGANRQALYDALFAAATLDATLCTHTSGAAVDVFPGNLTVASVRGNPGAWQNNACAREFDRVMAAHGFCSLSNPELKDHSAWEYWHYEFPMVSADCVDPMLQYRGVPEPDPNHDTAP